MKKLNFNENYKLNNKNGITLVALVLTIIIMMILAGISIHAIVRRKWSNSKCKKFKI